MVKNKTKKQIEYDRIELHKANFECSQVLKIFTSELWDTQFDLDYIYHKTISNLCNASNKAERALENSDCEYTYTDYDKDHKHENFKNSTYIGQYSNILKGVEK